MKRDAAIRRKPGRRARSRRVAGKLGFAVSWIKGLALSARAPIRGAMRRR
jgi:hypothetical protein